LSGKTIFTNTEIVINSKRIYLCELKSKCTYSHIYKVSNNNNGEFLKSANINILNKPIID